MKHSFFNHMQQKIKESKKTTEKGKYELGFALALQNAITMVAENSNGKVRITSLQNTSPTS